jgi:hypothetical protein
VNAPQPKLDLSLFNARKLYEHWCALHSINGLQEPREWRDLSTPRQQVWIQLPANLAKCARDNAELISKAAADEKAEAAKGSL